MSDRELREEIDRLRAENESLKAEQKKSVHLKVSQKGAVSLYGMRRFPITLYKEEWLRILDMADEIRGFIIQNNTALAKHGNGSSNG